MWPLDESRTQHRTMLDMLDRLSDTSADDEELRKSLLENLRALLARHQEAQDTQLSPVLSRSVMTRPLVHKIGHECRMAESLAEVALDLGSEDPDWPDHVEAIDEAVRNHIEVESTFLHPYIERLSMDPRPEPSRDDRWNRSRKNPC